MANKTRHILSALAVVLMLVCPLADLPVSASGFDTSADAVIKYAYSSAGFDSASEWIDSGELSEWYAFALLRHGTDLDFDRYKTSLLSHLHSSSSVLSAVERQRYALLLSFMGCSDEHYVTDTPDETIGKGGIMSYVFGLHLLSSGIPSEEHTIESVTNELLSRRLSDGGWSLFGDISDVDVTAMTLQALAPYISDDKVKNAVDSALSYLSSVQLDSGGYKSYGIENPESSAQVVIALSSLGIDPATDTRFAKSGSLFSAMEAFKTADGGYSHTAGGNANATATVQVLLAMIAHDRLQRGSVPLYVMDAVHDTSDIPDTSDNGTDNDTTAADDTAASANTDTDISGEAKSSYKPAAVAVTIVISVAVAVILYLSGKKSGCNFAAVAIVAALVIAVILFVDFSLPEDYYGDIETKNNVIGRVTVSIEASAAIPLDADSVIPDGGVILPALTLPIEDGDTAYDITVEAARLAALHLETAPGSTYVRGIAHIYEFDFGELSGWSYTVNGVTPSVGCGEYVMRDGDSLVWSYVLEPTRTQN